MNDQVIAETPVSREQIAQMAYNVWEKAGRPQGRDWEFWFEAERQLLESVKKAVAPPTPSPLQAPVSPRETTVPPVARMEPARVQSAPTKPARKAARRSPGFFGNGKSRN